MPDAPLPPRAAALVASLNLEPHTEGGFYRRIYTSPASTTVSVPAGAAQDDGARACASAILFLLPAGGRSTLHELRSDELWLWQEGDALEVVELLPGVGRAAGNAAAGGGNGMAPCKESAIITSAVAVDALVRRTTVGAGLLPYAVPAGSMFGSVCPPVAGGAGFALVACVVTPGFDWRDFSHPHRTALLARFPGAPAASVIDALARNDE